MIREGDEPLIAICGPSKCGKTTLAWHLVPWFWRKHRLRSIVFDPFLRKHPRAWGPTAWATPDLEAFRRAVWGTKGCFVVWDESSDSIDRNAREDKRFFTRIRHEHRAFAIITHDFCVLTPMMRANLSDAFVFKQTEERAHDWRRLFVDSDMLQTAELAKREFIHKTAFEPVRRLLPSLEELGRLDFIP